MGKTLGEVSYVAVLPNGKEFFQTARPNSFSGRPVDVAREAARLWATTPRSAPSTVAVKVFQLVIKDGELHRHLLGTYDAMPTLERMTEDEYNRELEQLLAPIPPEFHYFIRYWSWEEGHSSGMEEVVQIAQSLAAELLPCCRAFEQRLRQPTDA